MERLTDCAQGYCEMYCKKYGHCFGDPGDCIFKDEIKLYEAVKSIEGIVPFDRLLELACADKAGRLVLLPFIPHSTMLNLSDPENLEVMEDVRLYVAWKSPSGIVFNSPYSIFLQNIEKGYIKPDIEDAEAALALKGGTHEADSV